MRLQTRMRLLLHCCAALLVINELTFVNSSWSTPTSGQYHIQTDEGPERYFRFQTDNGQFRKEKRLQDGTVIGTEAWIDAAGYLRQKDYIADKSGYRILKSKTVFVGQSHIEDAIKSTKSAPARSNAIADHGYVYSPTPAPAFFSTTPAPAPTKLSYLSPAEAARIEPSSYLGFDHYPDELSHPQTTVKKPVVHLRHHSEPFDAQLNSITVDPHFYKFARTTSAPNLALAAAQPSNAIEPPFESGYRRIRPIAISTSTPLPIASDEALDTSLSPDIRKSYGEYRYANDELSSYQSTTGRPPVALLALDINNMAGLLAPPRPRTYSRKQTQELLQTSDHGYEVRQSNSYDSAGSGFRYILPRQYHEEQQTDEQTRAGSFGYVDPFGIRRVVYYNASPERGFVHRNNNQFVGLDAPPYDPRPEVPFIT